MTVQELIEKLQSLPPSTRVLVSGYEGGYDFAEKITPVFVCYEPSPYCGDYASTEENNPNGFNAFHLS